MSGVIFTAMSSAEATVAERERHAIKAVDVMIFFIFITSVSFGFMGAALSGLGPCD
jgi:hypothetical protein